MQKNVWIWTLCSVMISCSGATPAPTPPPVEPASSTDDVQAASAPAKVERRADLDTSRIEIAPPLDTQQVLQDLSVQREVAHTYGKRKAMCEALEANDSDECGAHAECAARIEPDCESCHGGRMVCFAKSSGTERRAFGNEQGMLQCLGMSGTTWHIDKGDPGAPTDQVYQQCLCDAPAPSIDSFVKQGVVRPNAEAGMCISKRALCEQEGGQFQEARLLGKVSPKDYAAHGLSVQLNEMSRWCGVSVSRPSEAAADDDVFMGLLENEECVVYRFKGYKLTESGMSERMFPRYQVHTCQMP